MPRVQSVRPGRVLTSPLLIAATIVWCAFPIYADQPSQASVPQFVAGSWTLAVLPDTQNYATFTPGLLRLQMHWIVENKNACNIAYAVELGDLTNNSSVLEWQRVDNAFRILDAAAVPYALVPGNHDYTSGGKDRGTLMSDYFPPWRFKTWPTFGGVMDANRIENNYHRFKAGSRQFIIVGLEFGPRDSALDWADKIIAKYLDHKAIVFTHAYLYDINSVRYNWSLKGKQQDWNPHAYAPPGSVNDGEEMWHKLIKKHANICLVISGHVCHAGRGLGFQVSTGEHGNRVNEMAVDYQGLEVGGGAWLRILEFLPDGRTVQAKTYSPLYDKYDSGPENQFTFTID